MSQANGDLPAIVHDETHETAHKMEAEEFMNEIYLQPIAVGARKKRPSKDTTIYETNSFVTNF